MEVIKIYRELRPLRMTRIVSKASQVLEIPKGKCPFGLKEGDSLILCTN